MVNCAAVAKNEGTVLGNFLAGRLVWRLPFWGRCLFFWTAAAAFSRTAIAVGTWWMWAAGVLAFAAPFAPESLRRFRAGRAATTPPTSGQEGGT